MNRVDLLDLIAQHTKDVVPGLDAHTFDASDRLIELGANSVDRAEIAMLVQGSLGLAISRLELFGPKNIGELADLFLQKLELLSLANGSVVRCVGRGELSPVLPNKS